MTQRERIKKGGGGCWGILSIDPFLNSYGLIKLYRSLLVDYLLMYCLSHWMHVYVSVRPYFASTQYCSEFLYLLELSTS